MTTSAHLFPVPFGPLLLGLPLRELTHFASAFFPQDHRFLSSAPILFPDTQLYCSSFQLSSRFSSQRLHGAPLLLSSHRFFPFRYLTGFPFSPFGFAYSASCLFPFALPCFAPAAVQQVLTFRSPSGVLHCFRILSSASALGFNYSASASSFPSLPRFASQSASRVLRICFRASGLPLSVPPGFPCVPSRF